MQAERARNWPSRGNVERKARPVGTHRRLLRADTPVPATGHAAVCHAKSRRAGPAGATHAPWSVPSLCRLSSCDDAATLLATQRVALTCTALTIPPAPVCCHCQADAKKRKQRLQSILEQQRKLGHFEASRECSALLADAEPPRKKQHAGKHSAGASGGTPSCAAARKASAYWHTKAEADQCPRSRQSWGCSACAAASSCKCGGPEAA